MKSEEIRAVTLSGSDSPDALLGILHAAVFCGAMLQEATAQLADLNHFLRHDLNASGPGGGRAAINVRQVQP